jgi:hypothetical protein
MSKWVRELKVTMEYDRMGSLLASPVNQRVLTKMENMVVEHHREGSPGMHTGWRRAETEKSLRSQSVIFLQREDASESFLEEAGLTPSERSDLEAGWAVTKLMPEELVWHYFFYANEMPGDY